MKPITIIPSMLLKQIISIKNLIYLILLNVIIIRDLIPLSSTRKKFLITNTQVLKNPVTIPHLMVIMLSAIPPNTVVHILRIIRTLLSKKLIRRGRKKLSSQTRLI